MLRHLLNCLPCDEDGETSVVGQHLRVHHGPGHLSFVLIRNRLPRKAGGMQTDVLGFGQNSGSYFQALPSDLLIFHQSILSEEHSMEKTKETVPHGMSSHSRGQGSWQESAPGEFPGLLCPILKENA